MIQNAEMQKHCQNSTDFFYFSHTSIASHNFPFSAWILEVNDMSSTASATVVKKAF